MNPKLLTAERFVDIQTEISYRFVHSDTEYFRPHFHDYYEIFIPLSGKALHVVNGKECPLHEGMIVFVRPNDTHDYVCSGNEPFHMLNLSFTKATADELFSFLGEGFPADALLRAPLPPTASMSDEDIRKLHTRMTQIRIIDSSSPDTRKTFLRMLLFQLIADHFSRLPESTPKHIPLWLTELCEKFTENDNFIKGISVLPDLTHKSREHVSRCMKKYYAMTVSEYINGLRLNYIASMLRNSDHKILDIIFESGFNNVSWCCQCFIKKYGVTMSDYRKNNQKN